MLSWAYITPATIRGSEGRGDPRPGRYAHLGIQGSLASLLGARHRDRPFGMLIWAYRGLHRSRWPAFSPPKQTPSPERGGDRGVLDLEEVEGLAEGPDEAGRDEQDTLSQIPDPGPVDEPGIPVRAIPAPEGVSVDEPPQPRALPGVARVDVPGDNEPGPGHRTRPTRSTDRTPATPPRYAQLSIRGRGLGPAGGRSVNEARAEEVTGPGVSAAPSEGPAR